MIAPDVPIKNLGTLSEQAAPSLSGPGRSTYPAVRFCAATSVRCERMLL